MTRCAGWARKLNDYLLEAQTRYTSGGFVAGQFDCCIFVADWVEICTGEDPMIDYREQYDTEADGFDLLADRETSLRQALESRFGAALDPSQAQRGDVAFIESLNACGICIVQGAWMRALFLGNGGFVIHRTRDCDAVFRVG